MNHRQQQNHKQNKQTTQAPDLLLPRRLSCGIHHCVVCNPRSETRPERLRGITGGKFIAERILNGSAPPVSLWFGEWSHLPPGHPNPLDSSLSHLSLSLSLT